MKFVTGMKLLGVVGVAAFSFTHPLTAGAAVAAPVKLSWSASPDTDVTGYAVYYGPVNTTQTRMDVGANLQAVIPNLTADASYSFKVVAYNADEVESVPSNAVQYNPTVLTKVQLLPLNQTTMRVRFRGPAGASCRVQYTSSLSSPNWQTLGTAVASADGTIILDDRNAGSVPMRFYRAVYP